MSKLHVAVAALAVVMCVCAIEAQQAAPTSPAASTTAAALPPVDARLESCRNGNQVALSSFRGRIVIGFYEDRESTAANEPLKGELQRFIVDNHLERHMMMLGLANAAAYDYAPARSIVRTSLAVVANRIGLDILIDFSGLMLRAPFNCGAGSNVLLFDATGRIAWRHTGPVTGADRTAFFRVLRRLVPRQR